LNLHRISKDFNYSKTVRLQEYAIDELFGKETLMYPLKGPKFHKLGFDGSFRQQKYPISHISRILTDVRPKDARDGFHLIIHDPYEIPSDRSVNFYTLANQTVEYLIDPKITSIDDTLRSYDPEE
jgi:hypothetical protein